MTRTLAVLGAALALVGWTAAQETKTGTGTQPGQTLPGPFRAFVVTGPAPAPAAEGVLPEDRQNLGDTGRLRKFHDFVTRYGLDPTVAVFNREAPPSAEQPLGKLLQALDEAVSKNTRARLRAFGVFLTLKGQFLQDEAQAAQVKQIEAFAQQLKLTNVPLALDQAESERTKAYGIGPDQALTVMIWSKQVVRARWGFTADKPPDDAAVQAVLAEVNKLVAPRR